MHLNDEQVRYGFAYGGIDPASVITTREYAGQEELTINCTQLGGAKRSAKEKKRIVTEWCDLLTQHPTAFKSLQFGTRMPQELFDAVCHQENLECLVINWGAYRDLSAIEKLRKLKFLGIGSGAGVESVRPIGELVNLIALGLENFQKITDYSDLTALGQLESLSICGDGMGPQYIKVTSLEFLRKMTQLRSLRLLTIRLQNQDYSPILALTQLERLDLRSHRDVKKMYDELCTLPQLKWGLLKEKPELYSKKG
ncbi:MAG: leucine-rich repeat domain-containing protein [Rhodopirellula sp.]|nr:leucine-rich repeat domain-containing protein [Rhodopirellula sp.]